jgi:hypothetical protein
LLTIRKNGFHSRKEESDMQTMHEQYLLDPTRPPNLPIPFGYKTGWIVLRTNDAPAVLQRLRLTAPQEISWGAGMLALERIWEGDRGLASGRRDNRAATERVCFVTPCVRGWIAVLGPFSWGISWRYQEMEALITKLSRAFGEAQSFLTDRVPEIHHWMLAREGVLLRSVVYVGESGMVWSDYGERTPIEQPLDWDGLYAGTWFPDEANVMTVAGDWSLNPTTLDTITLEEVKGMGMLAQLPHEAVLEHYALVTIDPTSLLPAP